MLLYRHVAPMRIGGRAVSVQSRQTDKSAGHQRGVIALLYKIARAGA